MSVKESELGESGILLDDTPWFCETFFSYLKLPKALFVNPTYRHLSLRAKVCYAFLLERAIFSYKNKWRDKERNVFVYYTLAELSEKLGCTESRCTKAYRELERAKLCKRVRQGQGRPSRVVVLPIIETPNLKVKTEK